MSILTLNVVISWEIKSGRDFISNEAKADSYSRRIMPKDTSPEILLFLFSNEIAVRKSKIKGSSARKGTLLESTWEHDG